MSSPVSPALFKDFLLALNAFYTVTSRQPPRDLLVRWYFGACEPKGPICHSQLPDVTVWGTVAVRAMQTTCDPLCVCSFVCVCLRLGFRKNRVFQVCLEIISTQNITHDVFLSTKELLPTPVGLFCTQD